jgi:uncharacterized protein (TIGR02231 family)
MFAFRPAPVVSASPQFGPILAILLAIERAAVEGNQKMPRNVLLSGVVFVAALNPALAEEIKVDLKLEQVTVNPRGAQLVRAGEIEVPAGAHEIILDTLPQGIAAASVQVEGKSEGDTEIGTVDVSTIALDPEAEASGELKALQDELEALARDRARQDRVLQDAQFRRSTLERLTGGFGAVPFANGDKPSMSPEQIGNLLLLTNRELSEISTAILDAQLAVEKINKREQVVQRKIQLLAQAPRAHTRVAVQVSAAAPAKMTLSLKYTVPNAGWRPVYDARLDLPADGKPASLELVQRALVFQRSGEAWDGVNLKLSTATVTGRTSAPVLEPVGIGPRPELKEEMVHMEADSVEQTALSDEKRAARKAVAGAVLSAAPRAVRQREAEVVNAGFHAVYTIAGQSSVPNDGSLKSVRIGSKTVTPELRIDTAPQIDPTGYLTGVFKIAGEAPLVAGEVSLFRDGVFAGKARMAQITPGEEAELGFGRDDLVRVTRRELENKAGSSGIITEQSTLKRLYVSNVENLHTFPVKVRMSERMPYSKHEDVKVEMLTDTTKPSAIDPDNKLGIVVWDIALKPDAISEVRFGYSVAHPADMKVAMPR